MADQEIRLCLPPAGFPAVRCILSGGEPVVVLVDLPTGRAATMIHMVLKNNPKVKEHSHKATLNDREAWVADRQGIREMRKVFGSMNTYREDTRAANEVFVQWMRETLIPFLDGWATALRGVTPAKVYSGFIQVNGNRVNSVYTDFTMPFTNAEETQVRFAGPDFAGRTYTIQSILKALKLIP